MKAFDSIAKKIAEYTGSASIFMMAVFMITFWFVSGFLLNFSDTWQLIINTITSIITFLMVFLIQHTQNRDSMSLHIKLDELIRVHRKANNSLINLDNLSDTQIKDLEDKYKEISIQVNKEETLVEYINMVANKE
jgi:low affinity Fe/Cu permease